MLTFKLKIKNEIDVSDYCKRYSFLFRKLHSNFELSEDKKFCKQLEDKYKVGSWVFESCRIEVKKKLDQEKTQKNKQLSQIKSIKKELDNNDFIGVKGKRRKFRLNNKLASLIKNIDKKPTFGSLKILQRISFLSNNKEHNQTELENLKSKYKQQRKLAYYSIGNANQKQKYSNRKFNFDLTNQQIIFKPKIGAKININFYSSKNQQKTLDKLQTYIGAIPISVRLDNDYVCISFDEQKLNNYEFKEKNFKADLKKLTKSENTKEARKEIFKKHIREQEERQLTNKLSNRYLAVDLNPQYIGFCIVDKMEDNSIKIIHKECVDLSMLSNRLRLSSTDKKQLKQNNKRKFEICQVWKHIFGLATHFKVAYFVNEELNFKEKSINDNPNTANYKTKNIWHRTLTTNLINKYCNSLGIKNIEVNPAYSSFIGNIQYDYFDPINASLEIARRAVVKYDKGSSIFPVLSDKDKDTMYQLGLDVPCCTALNWKSALGLFVNSGLIYRKVLDKTKILEKNLASYKSNVKLLIS